MDNIILNVRDFSISPGTREKDEGKNAHSGEEFREDFMIPKFKDALEEKVKLIIDLDRTVGYGTSWLEEVFGGLTRQFGKEKVNGTLEIISEEEPYLIDDINGYIEDAEKNN